MAISRAAALAVAVAALSSALRAPLPRATAAAAALDAPAVFEAVPPEAEQNGLREWVRRARPASRNPPPLARRAAAGPCTSPAPAHPRRSQSNTARRRSGRAKRAGFSACWARTATHSRSRYQGPAHNRARGGPRTFALQQGTDHPLICDICGICDQLPTPNPRPPRNAPLPPPCPPHAGAAGGVQPPERRAALLAGGPFHGLPPAGDAARALHVRAGAHPKGLRGQDGRQDLCRLPAVQPARHQVGGGRRSGLI